jgi:hypothetical protein
MFRCRQRCDGILEPEALEQHLLVERSEVGCARLTAEGFRQAADLFALLFVVGAIGKGGEEGNAKDGTLLVGIHGIPSVVVWGCQRDAVNRRDPCGARHHLRVRLPTRRGPACGCRARRRCGGIRRSSRTRGCLPSMCSRPDVGRRVLVAAVAGVAAVVVAHVAGNAAGVVVTIQREVLVVVEGRRRPFVLVVALAAIAGDLPVQRIGRRLVAVLALCAGILLQQGMVEASLLAEAFHAGVVAVAGDAVLADQLLVERRRGQRLGDRLPGGRQAAHVGRLVAGDAARRRGAGEGRMAGEAVRFELAGGRESACRGPTIRWGKTKASTASTIRLTAMTSLRIGS